MVKGGCCRIISAIVLSTLGIQYTAVASAASAVTAVWANDGGDKVAQDELRASQHKENLTGFVRNRVWDGSRINLASAHNEVVSFNLVLEAAGSAAQNVTVHFDTLTGPNGVQIHSNAASGNGVFEWVDRPIELFYARYVQIKGLSYLGYGKWDENVIPVRFQRPHTVGGSGYGLWTDRPDHDRFYPDALVPEELIPSFAIAGGQNQSIWSDIYVSKSIPSGVYSGNVSILESGQVTMTVPVQLTVNNFVLPDTPSAKTMIPLDTIDLQNRYVAGWGGYANWTTPAGQRVAAITDRYFALFHRHKLTVVGENECSIVDHPCDSSLPRLTGDLYTAAKGYDGPGVNTPAGLFSIGTYGTWGQPHYGVPGWQQDQALFWEHTNAYVDWFEANLPGTDFHLYLEDEPPPQDFAKVNTWAQWIKNNPGSGQRMPSLTTHDIALAKDQMPDVDIPVTEAGMELCPGGVEPCDNPTVQQSIANFYKSAPRHHLWIYNNTRPSTGTALTEDDGIAMRQIPWAQYKKHVDRYMYWYANVNNPTDWYQQATTWGNIQYVDPVIGATGYNGTSNGNGLLVYPGSTVYAGQTNYGVDGPVASLRLKEWRRGIQDVDYLTLASQFDPTATQNIVNRIIPLVLWEYPTQTPSFYTGQGQSWSSDPDVWETARAQLAAIIAAGCATISSNSSLASGCSNTGSPGESSNLQPVPNVPAPASPPSAVSNPAASSGLQFIPMAPCRIIDTRVADSFSGSYLQASSTRTYLLNSSPCPIPETAATYALNITVVPHHQLRWLNVWPFGQPQPVTSTLNSYDGRTKANSAIMSAGVDHGVSVFATDDTDLIVDITGAFVPAGQPQALAFYPLPPCRLVDTRLSNGPFTGPFLSAKTERRFQVLNSSCPVPPIAAAYSLNYTAIPHHGLAYLSAYPSDQARPGTSILNAPTNAVTAAAAITVGAANGGDISTWASDDTDLIIDVNGYFAAPSSSGLSLYNLSPCRTFDSRENWTGNPLSLQVRIDLADSSCGLPRTAQAAIFNTTVIPVTKLDYVITWPDGSAMPGVSTVNASDGVVASNLTIAPTTSGWNRFFLSDPGHLVLDLVGYFAP